MTRPTIGRLAVAGLVILALACAAYAQAPAQGKRAIDKLTYPKLNEIKMPEVVQETLPNGLKLMLVEDHSRPVVEFRALVKGGQVAEPNGKKGLADLVGESLRTGGTKSMAGDKVDEFLERIGAKIESDSDEAYYVLSGKTLVENLDKVLPLYAEFLTSPAFAQDKVDLAKTHMNGEISRRNDQVFGVTFREFQKLVYGKASPYARQIEYDDVDKLTREDCVALHKAFYRPDATIVACWGDFKIPEMKAKIASALGSWKVEGTAPEIAEPFVFPPAPSINYVEKKDVEQTFILLGHLGLKMDDPDYPAVTVMNDILGGGMSSRIFKEVREKRGLAYAAGGALSAAYDHPGALYVFCSTKPSTTCEVLPLMIEEVKKIQKDPVTDAELSMAKEGYLNSYAFQFDSIGKIIQRMQTYAFYGYPLDFNVKVRDAVEKVTKEDVLRVAQKHLHPDALTILAVGRQDQWDKPLSTFGQVNAIDITIPEPKPKETIPEPTADSLKRGQELLLTAAKAVGEQALRDLKDITTEGTSTVHGPAGNMDLQGKTTIVFPNRVYQEMTTPMGVVVQVMDGDKGWIKMGDNLMDMPAAILEDMGRATWGRTGAIMLLKAALDGKLEAQALGKNKFQGQDSEDVLVKIPQGNIRVSLTPDGKRVLGIRRKGRSPSGPIDATEYFSGYSAFSGLQLPLQTQQFVNGEETATVTVKEVKVNAGFSPDSFKKPEAKPQGK